MKSKMKFTTVIERKSDRLNPVIASFQNGSLLPDYASKFKVEWPTNNLDDMKVISPSGSAFNRCKTLNLETRSRNFIAIKNKKSNKVRLIEVDHISLMNSVFKDIAEAENVDERKKVDTQTPDKLFGGKKMVRRLEQKDKLKVDTNVVADSLKASVANLNVSDMKPSTSVLENESMSLVTPPCNRKASQVTEVYNLEDIITAEELELLSEATDEVLETKKGGEGHSQFFTYCLQQVLKNKRDVEKRVRALLYLDCLVRFIKLPARELQRVSKTGGLCQSSSIISDKIVQEFCVQTDKSVTRPLSMRDKALCYAMTLALLCCDFMVDVTTLGMDSGQGFNKLLQLGTTIGAVPSAKLSKVLVLKLPLPALPSNLRKRRAR